MQGNRKREEKVAAGKRRRFHPAFLAVLAAVLLFGTVTTVFAFFSIMRVEKVEIIGTSAVGEAEFLRAAEIEKGDFFFAFSAKKSARSFSGAYPAFRDVRVKKVLPGTVRVTLTEDVAVYTLVSEGTTYRLSADLRVMGTGEKTDAIFLELPPVRVTMGEKVLFEDENTNERMHALLADCAASSVGRTATRFEFADRFDLRIVTENGVLLKLGSAESAARKLQAAEKILAREDTGEIRAIDLGDPEAAIVEKG